MTLIAHHLKRQGTLAAIEEQVRFARRRFGRYEVIDFVAVLLGYAISGERTLEAFYEGLLPWASAFMALFGRDRQPARATLSRFLSGLNQSAVEALRALFLQICWLVLSCTRSSRADCGTGKGTTCSSSTSMERERRPANVPCRKHWIGPAPQRRLRPLCAPGYTGRKRGEVVRTRTTVLQAHTHQWLATFGNSGNGSTGQSCVGRWRPSRSLPARLIIFQRSAPSYAWMGNMAPEPS